MVIPGVQGGPLMHVIAAKAVAFREALSDEFKIYGEQVIKNARAFANRLINHGFKIISGGTDNHLMLVDLRNKDLTGKQAQEALDEVGITVNKNGVPWDDKSPLITSGIRIGTPALTTRGMKETDMEKIADMIRDLLININDENVKKDIMNRVKDITDEHPLYPELFTS
jgi:glycine hydroxymethyltransferase